MKTQKKPSEKSRSRQAIEAPRQSLFLLTPEELIIIGRDTQDGPSHPRYDVRAHNSFEEPIVLGMMEFGVEEIVSVVKVGDNKYEILNGRQRTINAREANRRLREMGAPTLRVKVQIKRGSDARLANLMLLLNEHRVLDTPYGLGQKAQQRLDMGCTMAEVALFMKVTEGTVKNYISLLDLKPEIQKMVIHGEVPASKGYELAAKGEKGQKAFLERLENGSRSGPPKRTPSKTALRKLVEAGELPELVLMGLKFALGDIQLEDLPKAAPVAEEVEGPQFQVVEAPVVKSANPFLLAQG